MEPQQRAPGRRSLAKARKRLRRAAVAGAAGAAEAAAVVAALCYPCLSEREVEVWLPSALRGDPLGLWGLVGQWVDEPSG